MSELIPIGDKINNNLFKEIIFNLENNKNKLKESIELLESLKNSKFYNSELKMWNFSVNPEKDIEHPIYETKSQLLSCLVDYFLVDKKEAKEKYFALKETKFFDQENNFWRWGLSKNWEIIEENFNTDTQLIGVLVEIFLDDKDKANESFYLLKNSQFFNKDRNFWFYDLDRKDDFEIEKPTDLVLLDVILKGFLDDFQKAKEEYQKIKKSEFFDSDLKFWNKYIKESINRNVSDISSYRVTFIQLLGVIAEILLGDKKEAIEFYLNIKKSKLWDENKKQFVAGGDKNLKGVDDFIRFSYDQLLGILADSFVKIYS